MCQDSLKVANLRQGLIRKGFITDEEELTINGTELLAFVESKGEKKYVKRKPATAEFDKWWKTFPGTDIFTHKNRKFSGNRSLRTGKEECRLKFEKILLEGEYTAAQLTEALEYDVLSKKEASILEGTNKLKYMQNSLTYLNQRSYEPFIELIQEGIKATPVSSGSFDI